jgi:hypothetical protein
MKKGLVVGFALLAIGAGLRAQEPVAEPQDAMLNVALVQDGASMEILGAALIDLAPNESGD